MEKRIEELTMEEAYQGLDELLSRMETEKLTLEETFRLYTEGVKLVARCREQIDGIEKQLLVLEEQAGTKKGREEG